MAVRSSCQSDKGAFALVIFTSTEAAKAVQEQLKQKGGSWRMRVQLTSLQVSTVNLQRQLASVAAADSELSTQQLSFGCGAQYVRLAL